METNLIRPERWEWRGEEGSEVRQAITSILGRVNLDRGNTVDDFTATRIVIEKFLDNRLIDNKQIIAITQLTLDDFSQGRPESITDKYPNYQELPGHQMAVDLLAIFIGEDPELISLKLKGLGFTGTPGIAITYATDPLLLLGTIVHDFTSYIDSAFRERNIDAQSLNKTLFGIEGDVISALAMAAGVFYDSLLREINDFIPDDSEVLKIIDSYGVNEIEQELALRQTVTRLGEIGGTLGTKLALIYGDQDFSSQLITRSASTTIGGWIGDAINFDILGTSLPSKALYRRLTNNFSRTTTQLASSSVGTAFNEAFGIEDSLSQIGIDLISGSITEHAFSAAIVEAFGKDFSVDYLGMNPDINLNLAFDSITGEIINSAFPTLKGFIGSKLFDWLDDAWSDVSLNNNGAVLGGFLGGIIAPGIGNFLGQVVGGWLWDIATDEDPAAYNIVSLEPNTSTLSNSLLFEDDGGRVDVAQEMGQSARDTLQLILSMIGGTPTYIAPYRYGHFEEDFVIGPVDNALIKFEDYEDATHQGIISQLKTLEVEDGNTYMMQLIKLPEYNPTLEQLFIDLGVAQEYGIHKKDPFLYGQMLLNVEDKRSVDFLINDWRRVFSEANRLEISKNSDVEGGEFIAGSDLDDELIGGPGNDFLYGGKGNDILVGGDGNDYIMGDSANRRELQGADILFGGNGNDILLPGLPDILNDLPDHVDGGDGFDTLILDYSSGLVETARGISNLKEGFIHHVTSENRKILLHQNIERFKIVGTKYSDSLKGSMGDSLDGQAYSGTFRDTLYFDLSEAMENVVADFSRPDNIFYGDSIIRNFENIGELTTGSGNDFVKAGFGGTVGTIKTGAGNDVVEIGNDFFSSDPDTFIDGGEGYDALSVDFSSGLISTARGITNLLGDYFSHNHGRRATVLKHSGFEAFNIIGTQYSDSLSGKLGDSLDGGKSRLGSEFSNPDTLFFDLSEAKGDVLADFTQAENISYFTSRIRNFENIGNLATGSGNDFIKTGKDNEIKLISTNDGDDVVIVKGKGAVGGGHADTGLGFDILDIDFSEASIFGVSNPLISEFRGRLNNAKYFTSQGVESFKITGTVREDHLYGGEFNDVLIGNGGSDRLRAGLGDDIYHVNAQSGGTLIKDDGGTDTLIIDDLTLSLQLPKAGIYGLQRQGNSLVIDLDQSGMILSSNDLTIENFFGELDAAGSGFIETVGNLSGDRILSFFNG
ncbi:MAG: hypothetical protein ACFCVD_05450 [Nodosilinea sp.]